MIKRLAWRLQALAEGGLSERTRQRAAELANDADLRLTPSRVKPQDASAERVTVQPLPPRTDERLPPPGSLLVRPSNRRPIFEWGCEFMVGVLEADRLGAGYTLVGLPPSRAETHFFRMWTIRLST